MIAECCPGGGDGLELDDIDPAFPALVLGNEGLGLAEALGQIHVVRPGFLRASVINARNVRCSAEWTDFPILRAEGAIDAGI